MKHKTVYLSGPITGNENYEWEFSQAEATLADRFRHVINPAAVLKPVAYLDYTALMHMCAVLVSQSDAIIMLPGWRSSKGARQELRLASHYGMQVLEYADETGDLIELYPPRKTDDEKYFCADDDECLGLLNGMCDQCPVRLECSLAEFDREWDDWSGSPDFDDDDDDDDEADEEDY